jgi:4-amino-4-deoxy-L-arabinose transferase-like glycosyltransferase
MSVSIRKTIIRLIGFILSMLLIFVGILLMREHQLLPGGILLVLAVGLFLFSVWLIEKNPISYEDRDFLKPYLFPVLFIIAALVLTGLLIVNINHNSRTAILDHYASAEWLLSILCLTVGVFWVARWKFPRPRSLWEWIKSNPFEFGLIAAILVASLAIRTIYLTQHPYPWSGDEASIGMEARRFLNGENTNWFSTGWSGQPNVSFLPTVVSMLIFGPTFFAIKLTSAIAGTLAVLSVYLLGREWFGKEIGLLASAFLAAYPYHLHFSRIGVNNVLDSLIAPLVIWLIFHAIRTRSLPNYLLAGVASGLTFYTYVGTRLTLAMAIGTFIYVILRQRGYWKASRLLLGTYMAALLVTLAPIGTFFIKNPGLFLTRINQEGILLNGWLPNQVKVTGQSVWQILFRQFADTILVFFSQNATYFLNFDRPYLTVLGAIFFVIGLAIAFRYLLQPRYFILQAWFWSVVILGGFLTLNPPANTRLLMTIPVTGLFIALGIWQLARVLLALKVGPSWVYSVGFAVVIILAIQNLYFYFGTYWQNHLSQDANSELAMEAGLQLQQLGVGYDYYVFGLPRLFAGFPTTEFLAPGVPKYDLNADSLASLTLNNEKGALIIAIPENQALLEQVMERYPGGKWEIVPRKVKNEVLYYAYVLSPEQINSP